MRLHLLGVRGSTPAPGAEFVRYGGHTSCVAISHDDSDEPTLVLDAGTGLRLLSPLLTSPAFRGTILLTHLHWDHVQGLPFFAKGDRPGSDIDLFVPAQESLTGRNLIARFLSPPYFPILPEGLQGSWRLRTLAPGSLHIGGFEITAFDVEHKGGRTFGYRVSDASGSVAYVPDHAAVSRPTSLLGSLRGVDVLIHDSQFLESEREIASRFGHATVRDSIELATEAGAARVVLFHHAPGRTDDQLDTDVEAEIAASTSQGAAPLEVLIARGGMTVTVGSGP